MALIAQGFDQSGDPFTQGRTPLGGFGSGEHRYKARNSVSRIRPICALAEERRYLSVALRPLAEFAPICLREIMSISKKFRLKGIAATRDRPAAVRHLHSLSSMKVAACTVRASPLPLWLLQRPQQIARLFG